MSEPKGKTPNFFVIGAPKCGTTALSEYLRQHPNVCFSTPKEPMFFNFEWPSLQIVTTVQRYLDCFAHCKNERIEAVGEGSALYLLSREAVPRIIDFNPSAKFIIMVRNPFQMVRSLHAQNLFYGDEDVESFEEAWDLQDTRANGQKIPANCRHPVLLAYSRNCKLGELVDRAFAVIPEKQRHVVVFDDFVEDTEYAYKEVLRFLDLPDDSRTSFPRVNERKQVRWRKLNSFLARPPHSLLNVSLRVKKLLGLRTLGIHRLIARMNSARMDPEVTNMQLKEKLAEAFLDDIRLLERLLGRNLDVWKE